VHTCLACVRLNSKCLTHLIYPHQPHLSLPSLLEGRLVYWQRIRFEDVFEFHEYILDKQEEWSDAAHDANRSYYVVTPNVDTYDPCHQVWRHLFVSEGERGRFG
jgi:hypothetical protein